MLAFSTTAFSWLSVSDNLFRCKRQTEIPVGGFPKHGGCGAERKRGYAMTTLKIGIASYDRMKARTIAIARGELKVARGEPTVWFTSIEGLAKVLSEHNRELLALIVREAPDSLTRLAELAGRSKSNLSRTLKTMSRYGLVELIKGESGTIVPQVPCDRLNLHISLTEKETYEMSESRSHRNAKNKAAGRGGKTEAPLRGNQRLDAITSGGGRATEVERSGTAAGLYKAASRLKKSGAPQKVLQVPQKDMSAAGAAMRKARTGGTVKNMGGTKRFSVRKPSR